MLCRRFGLWTRFLSSPAKAASETPPIEEKPIRSVIKKDELEKIRRENKAAVLFSPGKISLETFPLPVIEEDEVLLKMGGVAVSDVDLQLITYGTVGGIKLKRPTVVGGYGAGIVLATLGNTKTLRAGDRVVIEPRSYCGTCHNCLTGNSSKCRLYSARGIPPSNGLTSQFLLHPADFLHRIPGRMTMIEAAFVPMVARCLSAYQRAALSHASNLLVFGADVLGLTMINTSRTMGVRSIFTLDSSLYRLSLAKRVGSDFILVVSPSEMSSDLDSIVRSALGDQPDVVYCTSLATTVLRMAVTLAKPGGIIVLTGLSGEEVDITLDSIIEKKLTVLGNWECGNLMTKALTLMLKGDLSVDYLKPVVFPMSLSVDAFSAARANIPEYMAVFIRCNKSVR